MKLDWEVVGVIGMLAIMVVILVTMVNVSGLVIAHMGVFH